VKVGGGGAGEVLCAEGEEDGGCGVRGGGGDGGAGKDVCVCREERGERVQVGEVFYPVSGE